jgi:alanine dehydrogenase
MGSTKGMSIGLPRMHLELGERRVFLPEFVAKLENFGFEVFLERDYGFSIGLADDDYLNIANQIRFVDLDNIYHQDYVLVLRYPGDEIVTRMRPGTCLISMLHYPTRPQRVSFINSKNLQAISLDSIKDDTGRRLVENLASVAWNGLRVSFEDLRFVYPKPGFEDPKRKPVHVCLIGAGAVGKHVIQAAISYGDPQLREKFARDKVPGVRVTVIDYDLTGHANLVREILHETDILVDATQRTDPSQPVLPNSWLEWLPEHAIITDLAVDPYLLDNDPPVVRGIEGIPQGSLDKYVFHAEDPEWDLTVPAAIPSSHRRTVVSCYSWPGIFPEACMEHYAHQLQPIMKRLLLKGYAGLSLQGDYFERALYRGTIKSWLNSNPNISN